MMKNLSNLCTIDLFCKHLVTKYYTWVRLIFNSSTLLPFLSTSGASHRQKESYSLVSSYSFPTTSISFTIFIFRVMLTYAKKIHVKISKIKNLHLII
jgi:hypothetical protein